MKCDLSLRLNKAILEVERISMGMLFQTEGAAWLKERLPNSVVHLGMARSCWPEERRE